VQIFKKFVEICVIPVIRYGLGKSSTSLHWLGLRQGTIRYDRRD